MIQVKQLLTMTNQYSPEELLKLEDGSVLLLRPTNCARYGLEPYCNSTQDFSHGVSLGTNEKVKHEPEIINGKNQNWFTCQVNLMDGWTCDVKRIARSNSKKPGWLGQPGIFRGNCEYYSQRMDDMRKHFLSQHPGISKDFVYKCPVCLFGNKCLTHVRKHMDSCVKITKWAESGCNPSELCPNFIKNINHWSSQKTGGDPHHQKFEAGEEKKLLLKVREKTGGLTAKDVISATNVNDELASTHDVSTQDVDMSDVSMLLESETESSDDIIFGPNPINDIQTEESDEDFDVKQYHSVLRIFNDKSYREDRSVNSKNEVIRLLSQEVLEKRTLMGIGHKLNILRKKFEGYSLDTEFLWKLQDAFNTKLGGHIVKNEKNDSMESLVSFFPVDSLDAHHVRKVNELLTEYEKNFVALTHNEVIDLTGDDLEKEQKFLKLKQETADANEALQKSLADIILSKEQYQNYRKEAHIKRKKLDQKLSESTEAIEKLKKENQELKKLKEMEDCAQVKMQKLVESDKKRKNALTPIDLFKSLPDVQFEKEDGKVGAYGCHDVAGDNLRIERKKQEREDAKQLKMEQSKKRKLNSGYAAEFHNLDKNRKTMMFTSADPLFTKSRGGKKCGKECEDIREENYNLLVNERYVMVASALVYRQFLCSQAFCNYALQYLYEKNFRSRQKMYKFLYSILPRFITAFENCTGEMDSVRQILARKEAEAWSYFKGMPPSQTLAYFYCEDMLIRKTASAQVLNLCSTCDKHVASHPPNTCSMVTPELSQQFNDLRVKHNVIWEETRQSYDFENSQKLIAIHGIKKENVETY